MHSLLKSEKEKANIEYRIELNITEKRGWLYHIRQSRETFTAQTMATRQDDGQPTIVAWLR